MDMVVNVGALKAEDYELVKSDIAAVAEACHASGAILKVIIEAALLTDTEKEMVCRLAMAAGADYVKTSTGFHPAGGATVEAVRLLKQHANPLRIKASGGIRSLEAVIELIHAGADRIGASASTTLITELRGSL